MGFYDGESFNNSPAGQLLAGATGSGIELDATRIVAVAAFLRVINTLENIRASAELTTRALAGDIAPERSRDLLLRAASEVGDALEVLRAGALHADAAAELDAAHALIERLQASGSRRTRETLADQVLEALARARGLLVEG